MREQQQREREQKRVGQRGVGRELLSKDTMSRDAMGDKSWAVTPDFSGAVDSMLGDVLAHAATVKLDAASFGETQADVDRGVIRLPTPKPISLKVYFTDHSFRTFEVDEELTIAKLLTTISVNCKVKKIDTYALYDVSSVADPAVVNPATQVSTILTEWTKPVKLGKGLFARKYAGGSILQIRSVVRSCNPFPDVCNVGSNPYTIWYSPSDSTPTSLVRCRTMPWSYTGSTLRPKDASCGASMP